MLFQLFNFGLDNAFTFHHHERSYSYHEHIHQYAELVLIEKGELCVWVNERMEIARPGDFIFIFPFQPHYYRSKEHNVLEMYTFSPSIISRFFDSNRNMVGERAVFQASECAKSVFKSKLIDNKEVDSYGVKTCLYAMLCDFMKQVKLVPNETDGKMLTKLIMYVRENITAPIPLTKVAKEIGYSANYLSHCIKKTVGINYAKLLGFIRSEEARILIEATDKSSSQIALECGFGSERTFHRQFKEYCGRAPQEYRKRRREEIKEFRHPSNFNPKLVLL